MAISSIVFSHSHSHFYESETFGRKVIESLKLEILVIGFERGGVGEQLRKNSQSESVYTKNTIDLYKSLLS